MAKILYSCGNRIGADSQLSRFLKSNSGHEIKVAAYLKSSESIDHIDWTLNALQHPYNRNVRTELRELFGNHNVPAVGIDEVELLISEIYDFGPDLVICDYEPIVSHIAYSLNLRLWYCSPVHLLDGIKWEFGQLKYNALLAKERQTLLRLPPAEKTFIYSPFGDLENRPQLKDNFEWICPYFEKIDRNSSEANIAVVNDRRRLSILSKILNCVPPFDLTLFSPYIYNFSHLEVQNIQNVESYRWAISNSRWILTTGETSIIADAMYNHVPRLCITPDLNDPEALLNAILCEYYQIADDVGQVEYLEKYAPLYLENSYCHANSPYIINSITNNLTQKVNDVLCSI